MRVFLTGATGFVGSAIVPDLIAAGHQVIGLARSDAGAAALAAAGAEVHRGDVSDVESLRRGAERADGVVHTAFIHDFSKFKESTEVDRRAITAIGEVLAGSDRPFVVTSATGLFPSGQRAVEAVTPSAGANPRIASEEAVDAIAARGVRVSVLRLPPSVHGVGDHGFVPMLIETARQKGKAAYVGDGANRWAAVHRLDAARLYRLAIEANGAPGTRYHAVAEEGVPFRDIAGVIGRRLGVPVVSVSPDEAGAHFGWLAHFAALDNVASSERTREQLGWNPTGPGLIADVDQDAYFAR